MIGVRKTDASADIALRKGRITEPEQHDLEFEDWTGIS